MRPRPLLLAALAPLALVLPASGQEPVDWEAVGLIREEGLDNSKVMETTWYLTDVHGPRLTNSPEERRASEWAVERLTEFGLENAQREAWGEFGLGWSFQRCVVELVEPTYAPLIAIPKAWTRGLDVPVSGRPIHITAESVEELDLEPGALRGRIVLMGEVRDVPTPFEPLAERHDHESLTEIAAVPEPDPDRGGFDVAAWRKRREARVKMMEHLEAEGAAVVLTTDGGRRNDYGVIMLGSGGSYDPEEERAMPQIVVATEQFNRIARLLEKEERVQVRVDVATRFHDEDTLGYNVVAEIPGSDPDLADEIVMLGAHFDSWHPGTGATDNGASSAIVMEAARILVAAGLEPRRTVRVALWNGEEQGLHGSRGYVKNHFADPDTMELLPEHEQLAAYFNIDNGAGRIRGVYLQENLAVRPIFEAWLEPFHDLGATTLTSRNTGGTDHLSYDAVGLPGFQFIQDRMDYGSRTHHTNMDTYERVKEEDAKRASVVLAGFVWHAAQRDERLPRKPLPEGKELPSE